MKYFLVLCLIAEVFSASVKVTINGIEKMYYDINEAEELFEQFIVDFEKSYESAEEKLMRFEIFKEKLQHINDINMKHDTIYGITMFSDLTSDEFIQKTTGIIPEASAMPCQPVQMKYSSVQVGNSLDWRQRNVVTPIRSQGLCGSCWAHSIIGCLESQYALRYGQMLDLSEQQLVDCEPTNTCCGDRKTHFGGGWPSNAGIYLLEKGSMSESEYPYLAIKNNCSYNPDRVSARPTQCVDFSGSSEQDLMAILEQYGPISIVVDSGSFDHYKGGIEHRCQSTKCRHAVLLVGYNRDAPEPYWIIKNSWGTNWGEQGYIRIPMGSSACMITQCTMTGLQV